MELAALDLHLDCRQHQQPLQARSRSRPRRRYRRGDRLWLSHSLSDPLNYVMGNVISGQAHICFSKDDMWFHGSMYGAENCIYKVRGKLLVSGSASTRSSDDASSTSSGIDIPLLRLFDEESIVSTCVVPQRSSCCSDLSSSLEHLLASGDPEATDHEYRQEHEDDDPEEDEGKFFSSGHYVLHILDFDTGIDYAFDDVRVRRGESHCRMTDGTSGNIRFQATQSSYGNAADLLVNSHMGPSFVDLGLRVYTGHLCFTHPDTIHHPVTVTGSQWCL